MSSKKHPANPFSDSVEPMTGSHRIILPTQAWQPDGPTLRFEEMLRIIRVRRTKAYELMKSDPSFPQGVPLYDSYNSPKFYWTHEATAWSESRSRKFRSLGGV